MPNRGLAQLTSCRYHDRTRVEQYSCAPLQWLGPLDPLAPRPVFFLRNPNGGLLEGDEHHLSLTIGAHTQIEIRSQSATRFHPGSSQQHLTITLGEQSTLIWIPHPLIPGLDADIEQTVTVTMASGSRLAYAEIWTAGRIAMGEQWRFRRLHNRLTMTVDGQLRVAEQMHLSHPPQFSSVLGDYPCWGSLYLLGDWVGIPTPCTDNQWVVQRPWGTIVRHVGHESLAIWQQFTDIAGSLASAQCQP
ncbi:MAG: hypothetical protein OHK0012_00700 [Synechococcales cyanobacterium]